MDGVANARNLHTLEGEAAGLQLWVQPGLHYNFKPSLSAKYSNKTKSDSRVFNADDTLCTACVIQCPSSQS